MPQNRSTAVMNRRVEPRDSLDDYPTPPWATRALFIHVLPHLRLDRPIGYALEPAAGRGDMVRVLRENITAVLAADIHDYGAGYLTRDFLGALNDVMPPDGDGYAYDLIATNPPFRLAVPFAERALGVAPVVTLLVRTTWTESVTRYRLFQEHPPALIAQFAERVVMLRGRLSRTGSTATAYCWVVWARGQTDTRWRHIPPCRKQLERPGDYDGYDDSTVIARSAKRDEAIQPGSRGPFGPRDDGEAEGRR